MLSGFLPGLFSGRRILSKPHAVNRCATRISTTETESQHHATPASSDPRNLARPTDAPRSVDARRSAQEHRPHDRLHVLELDPIHLVVDSVIVGVRAPRRDRVAWNLVAYERDVVGPEEVVLPRVRIRDDLHARCRPALGEDRAEIRVVVPG